MAKALEDLPTKTDIEDLRELVQHSGTAAPILEVPSRTDLPFVYVAVAAVLAGFLAVSVLLTVCLPLLGGSPAYGLLLGTGVVGLLAVLLIDAKAYARSGDAQSQ